MSNTKLILLAVLFGLAAANQHGIDHIWEWRWFGAIAWLRTFDMWNFFTWFPVAIAWTRLNRGNAHNNSDYRFLWLAYKWAGIAGWFTVAFNLLTAIGLIAGHWDNENWMGMEDLSQSNAISYGVTIIIDQIVGQILYYFFRPGATLAAREIVIANGGQSVWDRDTWKYTEFDAEYDYLDEEDQAALGF